MKLRSRNITKYEDLDLIIDELLYILNTINKETKLEYRIYKTAELFELIISNKELILENNRNMQYHNRNVLPQVTEKESETN